MRAQLRWRLSDRITLTPGFLYQESANGIGGPSVSMQENPDGTLARDRSGDFVPLGRNRTDLSFLDFSCFCVVSPIRMDGEDNTIEQLSLTAEFEFDAFTLISTTNATEVDSPLGDRINMHVVTETVSSGAAFTAARRCSSRRCGRYRRAQAPCSGWPACFTGTRNKAAAARSPPAWSSAAAPKAGRWRRTPRSVSTQGNAGAWTWAGATSRTTAPTAPMCGSRRSSTAPKPATSARTSSRRGSRWPTISATTSWPTPPMPKASGPDRSTAPRQRRNSWWSSRTRWLPTRPG